jgi:hypothetical protein
MQQCPRYCGTLKEPATQAPRQLGGACSEPGFVERRGGSLTRPLQTVEPCRKREVLEQREIVVEQRVVRQEADRPACICGTLRQRLIHNADLAGGWSHEAGEKSQQSGLAGAVGANHCQRLAWTQGKVYAPEYADSPERALESTDLEQE